MQNKSDYIRAHNTQSFIAERICDAIKRNKYGKNLHSGLITIMHLWFIEKSKGFLEKVHNTSANMNMKRCCNRHKNRSTHKAIWYTTHLHTSFEDTMQSQTYACWKERHEEEEEGDEKIANISNCELPKICRQFKMHDPLWTISNGLDK